METSVDTLNILLRAAYPVIYVVSHEESRVESALEELIAKRNVVNGSATELWNWSFTEGSRCISGNNGSEFPEQDPADVLEFIGSYGKSAVFVLRDFGHFLDESSGAQSYVMQRQIKDVINRMSPGSTIVIVDSELNIPSRIEKFITVVDFDFPSQEEIIENTAHLLSNFDETRSLPQETREKLLRSGAEAAVGLTLIEAENVFAKSLAASSIIDPRMIIEEKKNIIRKSGVLEFYDVRTDMGAVGGLGQLKSWLSDRGRAFSKEARDYGLPHPKGVLLVGIPGSGKSLVSKCIGYSWKMPVLRMDVGALFGSLVGQSEANMRKALKTAEALAPCVLWIDELEKALGSGQGSLDGGTTARVFGSFLSWMQEKTSSVFVVATANDVSMLPPEMLRKGRFDELFFVDLPNEEDRETIFDIHLQKKKRDPSLYDTAKLAAACPGFSGAEIEQVVVDSLFKAFSDDTEPSTDDMLECISKTIPLSKTMSSRIEGLRKWADGRAVLAGSQDSVTTKSKQKKRRVEVN